VGLQAHGSGRCGVTRNPHVVLDFSKQPNQLRCNHCGLTQNMNLPASIDAVLKQIKPFERQHAKCKKGAQ
jgi:hypothetical protein